MRPPSWTVWNLFLAGIPLVLSVWLFRVARRRSPLWWCVLAAFVVFVPNAPYALTDLVHLAPRLRANPSWGTTVLLLTGFGLFFLAGFEAYVLSIANLRHYLRENGWPQVAAPAEIGLHALSAVGIYLGRVHRFNSWDIVGELDVVLAKAMTHLTQPWSVLVVFFTFGVTAVACEVLMRVNLVALRSLRRPPGR